MKNWKLIAEGLATGLSDADVEKIAPALDALDAALRPQAAAIPYEAEPGFVFAPSPEEDS